MQFSFLVNTGNATDEASQSLSESQASLTRLVDVCQRGGTVFLRKDGHEAAALLSFEEYKHLKALESIAKNTESMQEILQIRNEISKGDFSNFVPVENLSSKS